MSKWLALSLAFLIGALGTEILVRVVVHPHPETGIEMLGPVPLLPYRVSRERIQEAWEIGSTSTYLIRDPELGWTVKKSGAAGIYQANVQAIRADHDRIFAAEPPADKTRIILVGDSFSHGDSVTLEETWSSQLEKLEPNIEVLNFAVPGHGTDQAVLRFQRDTAEFQAHYGILGIWPENIGRNLNLFRFLLAPQGSLSLAKPRFIDKNDQLELVNTPTPNMETMMSLLSEGIQRDALVHEYWFDPFEQAFPIYYHSQTLRGFVSIYQAYQRREKRNALYSGAEPSGIQLTTKIAEAFVKKCKSRQIKPLILLYPMRELLAAQADSAQFPLAKSLRGSGLVMLDLGPTFHQLSTKADTTTYFQADGHLNAKGNRVVAEEVATWFRDSQNNLRSNPAP